MTLIAILLVENDSHLNTTINNTIPDKIASNIDCKSVTVIKLHASAKFFFRSATIIKRTCIQSSVGDNSGLSGRGRHIYVLSTHLFVRTIDV